MLGAASAAPPASPRELTVNLARVLKYTGRRSPRSPPGCRSARARSRCSPTAGSCCRWPTPSCAAKRSRSSSSHPDRLVLPPRAAHVRARAGLAEQDRGARRAFVAATWDVLAGARDMATAAARIPERDVRRAARQPLHRRWSSRSRCTSCCSSSWSRSADVMRALALWLARPLLGACLRPRAARRAPTRSRHRHTRPPTAPRRVEHRRPPATSERRRPARGGRHDRHRARGAVGPGLPARTATRWSPSATPGGC